MMRVPLLLASFALAFSGCVIVRPPPVVLRSHHSALRATPQCRPSQYWDGERCRHKGRGHGARKHDDD